MQLGASTIPFKQEPLDTAMLSTFKEAGVESLELQGELQPGTVSGVPASGSISDKLLITRAGGFGDKNALLELVSILEFGQSV